MFCARHRLVDWRRLENPVGRGVSKAIRGHPPVALRTSGSIIPAPRSRSRRWRLSLSPTWQAFYRASAISFELPTTSVRTELARR